jgi:hypothetical protein
MNVFEVLLIVVTVALVIIRSLPRRWIALLMPPTGPGPSTGEICVACNSRNVTPLAPLVYRCNACGHEGGDGWATWQRARRDAAFQAWSPAKRRKSAKRDLVEARTLILAGLGDLERAGNEPEVHGIRIRAGATSDFSNTSRVLAEAERLEHEQAKTSGLGRLLEAQARVRDAEAKLGTPLGDVVGTSLDENAHSGTLLADGTALLVAIEAELRSLRRGARA